MRVPVSHGPFPGFTGDRFVVLFPAYLVLALLLTWPLVLHPGSSAPGLERFAGVNVACDTWNQVWNVWWVSEVIAHRGALLPGESLYQTKHLFHPIGSTLALHTLYPIYGLAVLPIALIAGPVVAWNLAAWCLLALSAWATFRFVGRWGAASPGVAFVIGGAVAFSPYVMAHLAAGHLNLASIFWIPLYLEFFLRAAGLEPDAGVRAPRTRLRDGALAGAILAATAWAELYYLAFLLLATVATLAYVAFARRDTLREHASLATLAALFGTFALGSSPVFVTIARALRGGGFLSVRGYGFAAADLLSYLVPGPLTTVARGALEPVILRFTHLPQEWTLFPGYVFVFLAILGGRGWIARGGATSRATLRQPAFFLALGALLFFVLSLGIYLKVGGRSEFAIGSAKVRIPLPYLAATHLPLFKNLRSTARFGVVTIILLAPLAAAGFARLLDWAAGTPSRRRLVFAVTAALLAVERLALPFPVLSARVPAVYGDIGRDPGRFSVLEVPFGVRDGSWTIGREESRFQLHQTVHGRPILSGCVSRMREEVPRYFGEKPVTRSLLRFEAVGSLTPEEMAFDREGSIAFMRELQVKYVLVHTEMSTPERDYHALADYLARVTSPVETKTTPEGIVVLRLF